MYRRNYDNILFAQLNGSGVKTKNEFFEKFCHVFSVMYSLLLLTMFTCTDVGNFLQFLLSCLHYYLSPTFLLHTVPLHRWSSRRNNSHPLVMSSLTMSVGFGWKKKTSVVLQHYSSITTPYDTWLVCCATVQQEEHFLKKKTMWSISLHVAVDVVIPWALGILLFIQDSSYMYMYMSFF